MVFLRPNTLKTLSLFSLFNTSMEARIQPWARFSIFHQTYTYTRKHISSAKFFYINHQ